MYNLLIEKLKQNKIEIAEKEAKEILKNDPSNHKISHLLGEINFKKGQLDKAEKFFKQSIQLDSDKKYLLSMGNLYILNERYSEATGYFNKAILQDKNYTVALNNLSFCYSKLGDYKKSIKTLILALEIEKNNHHFMYNLANAYRETDELDKAIDIYNKAIKLKRDDKHYLFNKSLTLLKKRQYKEAWVLYENRIEIKNAENKIYKLVKDNIYSDKKIINKNSKIVILPEQGVGDQILQSSMYHDYLKLDLKTFIFIDERLRPLYERSFNFTKFINLNDFETIKKLKTNNYKFIYAASLGKFFRNSKDNFKRKSYLIANQEKKAAFKKRLAKFGNNKKFIGLSWFSQSKRLGLKSINLNNFSTLLKNQNFIFINLQYGDVEKEIEKFNLKNNNKIISFKDIDKFNDFESLTALIDSLDMVITIDNVTTHLSGSLGKKTYVITPYTNEYILYSRSNSGRCDWYPSFEIFYINPDHSDINKTINKINKRLKNI